jgi:hypothetical protein
MDATLPVSSLFVCLIERIHMQLRLPVCTRSDGCELHLWNSNVKSSERNQI